MSDRQTPGDLPRAILVLLATIATIAYNTLAALGLVNGVTPATISERLPSVITPAGYAFSIWSLIYLWMLAFSIYQLFPANGTRLRRIRTNYIISCLLNVGWIWCWHHGRIILCLGAIFGTAAVLFLICQEVKDASSVADKVLLKAPFGLYLGWITCASLVNLMVLVNLRVPIDSTLSVTLGVVCIVLAALASFLVRWKLNNYIYPLAVAWALSAIAVKQSGNTAIVVAAAFGTVVSLVTSGSIVTSLKDATSE
ncbi:MAG: hypothetical protein JO053_11450 [Acidobacteria bacterium]|nr:hypothetical protein [Acidobacteriota bacterium]